MRQMSLSGTCKFPKVSLINSCDSKNLSGIDYNALINLFWYLFVKKHDGWRQGTWYQCGLDAWLKITRAWPHTFTSIFYSPLITICFMLCEKGYRLLMSTHGVKKFSPRWIVHIWSYSSPAGCCTRVKYLYLLSAFKFSINKFYYGTTRGLYSLSSSTYHLATGGTIQYH